MISKRAKGTTTATVLGLGALAGFAATTNHGIPAATVASAGGRQVVTTTSGAATASQSATAAERAPIVTRSSAAPNAVPAGETDD